ncbi:MAG TPA: patatin-like phospholipase family protein, partial [Kofleriaceae bacterium]
MRHGLVLAGAAALGAYEVGVIQYLLEDLARELDQPVSIDILSGSSAGAINASALAALADDPIGRSVRLRDTWTELRLGRILRPSAIQILEMLVDLGGGEAWSRLCRRALVARG